MLTVMQYRHYTDRERYGWDRAHNTRDNSRKQDLPWLALAMGTWQSWTYLGAASTLTRFRTRANKPRRQADGDEDNVRVLPERAKKPNPVMWGWMLGVGLPTLPGITLCCSSSLSILTRCRTRKSAIINEDEARAAISQLYNQVELTLFRYLKVRR